MFILFIQTETVKTEDSWTQTQTILLYMYCTKKDVYICVSVFVQVIQYVFHLFGI